MKSRQQREGEARSWQGEDAAEHRSPEQFVADLCAGCDPDLCEYVRGLPATTAAILAGRAAQEGRVS